MQADLGLVSGGQASLYARARTAVDQATELLDSLEPLRAEADPEDCAAFRLLVRQEVAGLVNELGSPGGPRQVVVESSFTVLAGAFVPTGITADNVPGQLGALRDRFGLVDANVNTVEEERIRTSFWTLVDLITGLRRSWEDQKAALGSGTGSGFLGTDLVIISRLMAAAAEQLDEFEAVLNSAMVTPAERQTIILKDEHGQILNGLSLDGLIQWMRTFLTQDGLAYIRDAGRDGIRTAFAPTLKEMVRIFRESLVRVLAGKPDRTSNGQFPVSLLPASCDDNLPAGMYAARSRIAVTGLCRVLRELFDRSALLGRYPDPLLFEVQLERIQSAPADSSVDVRISLRGANLRDSYLPAILRRSGDDLTLERASDGRSTADEDTLVGVFPFTRDDPFVLELLEAYPSGAVLPASALPVGVVDGETNQVISPPSAPTWPDLQAFNATAGASGVPRSDPAPSDGPQTNRSDEPDGGDQSKPPARGRGNGQKQRQGRTGTPPETKDGGA
jgi:hypothetical protein